MQGLGYIKIHSKLHCIVIWAVYIMSHLKLENMVGKGVLTYNLSSTSNAVIEKSINEWTSVIPTLKECWVETVLNARWLHLKDANYVNKIKRKPQLNI